MSGVLLIPCVGPMQSWGTRSRFQERDTEREPTKSGIIGMLCAALGRDRAEPVEDLAALRMGVRADREGKLSRDFQTAQNVAVASGGSPQDLLSNRHFLADAVFLVGLEGKVELLHRLHEALKEPVWPIFLGRKSYVPTTPLYLAKGLVQGLSLRDSLMKCSLLISTMEVERRLKGAEKGRGDSSVRMVLESVDPTHERRHDQPVSFALGRRQFRDRFVITEFTDLRAFPLEKEGADVSFAADA